MLQVLAFLSWTGVPVVMHDLQATILQWHNEYNEVSPSISTVVTLSNCMSACGVDVAHLDSTDACPSILSLQTFRARLVKRSLTTSQQPRSFGILAGTFLDLAASHLSFKSEDNLGTG